VSQEKGEGRRTQAHIAEVQQERRVAGEPELDGPIRQRDRREGQVDGGQGPGGGARQPQQGAEGQRARREGAGLAPRPGAADETLLGGGLVPAGRHPAVPVPCAGSLF